MDSPQWKVSFCERCFGAFDYIPSPKKQRIYCDECRLERKRETERGYKQRRRALTRAA